MKFHLIRERQPAAYLPPVYLDGPHRERHLRRAQNIKLLLILGIVIATAAATRWLRDDEGACLPGAQRVVDVAAQGLD